SSLGRPLFLDSCVQIFNLRCWQILDLYIQTFHQTWAPTSRRSPPVLLGSDQPSEPPVLLGSDLPSVPPEFLCSSPLSELPGILGSERSSELPVQPGLLGLDQPLESTVLQCLLYLTSSAQVSHLRLCCVSSVGADRPSPLLSPGRL
ncbi:hypothetical protein LDENG_00257430, partial [Lucifuga dentata]